MFTGNPTVAGAPPEVQQKIQRFTSMSPEGRLQMADQLAAQGIAPPDLGQLKRALEASRRQMVAPIQPAQIIGAPPVAELQQVQDPLQQAGQVARIAAMMQGNPYLGGVQQAAPSAPVLQRR